VQPSWLQTADQLTPPTTPSPEDFVTTKVAMNGGFTLGRCAVHSPIPPPPKPPRDKKGREARGPLLAAWAARIGRQRLIVGGVTVLALALLFGIGVPFALDLRASRLLEARLQVVRRILKEAPLIDG
jgi:hypothetical protein